MYPLYDYGGSGAVIHMAIANGFPPLTYAPMLTPLTEHYRVVSLPPRPLWHHPPPPKELRSWETFADDFLAGLREHNLNNVVAIGHSLGSVTSLVAVARDPSRFRALILLDPTIFPRHIFFIMNLLYTFNIQPRIPIVQGALKRRARFANADEAFTYWRGKRLFHDWSDDVLHLYAESMTQPAADGQGVELTWSPEWEARIYETILATTWRYIPKLRVPVLIVRAQNSDTFSPQAASQFRRALPEAAYVEIEGYGHLFPHAAPERAYQEISRFLKDRGL